MKKEEKNPRRDNVTFFCYGLILNHPTSIAELEDEVEKNTSAILQAIDEKFIFNKDHAMFILSQSYEAYKRGIFIARKPKLDIILRLLCTQKIEKALTDGGVKKDAKNCVILGFCSREEQKILIECLKNYGIFDEHLIAPSEQKKSFLIDYHKITPEEQKNYDLVQLLCGRSATNLVRYYKSKA